MFIVYLCCSYFYLFSYDWSVHKPGLYLALCDFDFKLQVTPKMLLTFSYPYPCMSKFCSQIATSAQLSSLILKRLICSQNCYYIMSQCGKYWSDPQNQGSRIPLNHIEFNTFIIKVCENYVNLKQCIGQNFNINVIKKYLKA